MQQQADIIIVGAGIAGLVCALDLLKAGKSVLIIDAQSREKVGGLACSAFGGMTLIGTPEQKAKGIRDTPEIAYKDWCSFASFDENDIWPRAWAKHYVEHSITDIYEYIHALNVKFLPAVNWVERGLYVPGNSLPRYHILWGASLRLINQLVEQLNDFEGKQLQYCFNTKVEKLIESNESVIGCIAKHDSQVETEYYTDNLIIASGGFTGNLPMVKQVWPEDWGEPPKILLNGCHPGNDGKMHRCSEQVGAKITHLSHMYPYAAGIPHPSPDFDHQGLSLIPCKSALWVDHTGARIGPEPLVTGFDTNHMCRQISRLQLPHTWQLLNWRIAIKELAVSGCEYNPAIRDRKLFTLLKGFLLGNHSLLRRLMIESDHFIVADNLDQLVKKMNQLTPDYYVTYKSLAETISCYDEPIKRSRKFWNDDQIRRIMHSRSWLTDRLRTCYPKPMLDNPPLIAIKLNLITRKSLGGIKTDLSCRVLNNQDEPIKGLYAIGEAAGFGGGGASGKNSLEGTFLSGCILTARQASRSI